MRDVTRIDRILDKIRTIWYIHPDLRLLQLLQNAVTYNAIMLDQNDMYNIEDNQLEKDLDNLYGKKDQ